MPGAPGPRVPRGDEHERDAEAQRVGDGEDDAAPDGPAVGAERRGEREHEWMTLSLLAHEQFQPVG